MVVLESLERLWHVRVSHLAPNDRSLTDTIRRVAWYGEWVLFLIKDLPPPPSPTHTYVQYNKVHLVESVANFPFLISRGVKDQAAEFDPVYTSYGTLLSHA